MKKISITGKLVDECLIELKIQRIKNLIMELEKDYEDFKKRSHCKPDYDLYYRSQRFLR